MCVCANDRTSGCEADENLIDLGPSDNTASEHNEKDDDVFISASNEAN